MNKLVLNSGKEIMVDKVMLSNGFTENYSDNPKRHKILRKHFITSPENSRLLWDKDGKTYIFDGWNDKFPYKSLIVVDVTDIVEKYKLCKEKHNDIHITKATTYQLPIN